MEEREVEEKRKREIIKQKNEIEEKGVLINVFFFFFFKVWKEWEIK